MSRGGACLRKQGMANLPNVDLDMYFVYLIKSTFKKWVYVGFTKDINLRLIEHNYGNVQSTKPYKPFDLIFVQVLKNTKKARDFEKFLKVRFNKEALIELLN